MRDGAGGPHPVAAVLGATGSIGTHVVSAFEAKGYRVLGFARNRPRCAGEREFFELDLSAAPGEEIAEILTKADARLVVNAAGGWLASLEDNRLAHAELVERLLDAAALMPVPPRIVQIGSVHEYGAVPHGTAIDESVEPKPQTPYGLSKLAGSDAVVRAARAGAIEGVVLRAVNVYGPGTEGVGFLGSVVRGLRDLPPGDRLRLKVGTSDRDFVDVRDLSDAVVRAAESSVTGRIVNIGRGEALAMRRILELLVAESGHDPEVLELTSAAVDSKGGDWTLADIRLAHRLLGWAPKIPVRQSLRDMWNAAGGPR